MFFILGGEKSTNVYAVCIAKLIIYTTHKILTPDFTSDFPIVSFVSYF